MTAKTLHLLVVLVALYLGWAAPAWAGVPPSAGGASLFDQNDVIALELTAPFAALVKVRSGPSHYVAAQLRYVDADQREVVLPVEIRNRGKTRRSRDVCEFPPIRMRFGSEAAGTLFEGQESLKLVTHCNDKSGFDQYVVLEYLAYRAYNQLTARGHRVRLARITYAQTDGHAHETTRFGIFLEDWKAVGKRNDLEAVDVDGAVNITKLSIADANRVAVFQYMIGNDDWSVLWPEPDATCCHNTKPLLAPDGTVVPLPYDFDYAGIVNAPYARAKNGRENVRMRRYGGLCSTQASLGETLELFRARRQAIYALYRDQAELGERQRRSSLRYLDGFYQLIDDPEKVQSRMIGRCKAE